MVKCEMLADSKLLCNVLDLGQNLLVDSLFRNVAQVLDTQMFNVMSDTFSVDSCTALIRETKYLIL